MLVLQEEQRSNEDLEFVTKRSFLEIYNERINDEQLEIGIQSVQDVIQLLSTPGVFPCLTFF